MYSGWKPSWCILLPTQHMADKSKPLGKNLSYQGAFPKWFFTLQFSKQLNRFPMQTFSLNSFLWERSEVFLLPGFLTRD